jgi:hypothetical protein
MKKKRPPTLITYELVDFDPNSRVDFLGALPIPEPEPKFARPAKQRPAKRSTRPARASLPQPRPTKWALPSPAPRPTSQAAAASTVSRDPTRTTGLYTTGDTEHPGAAHTASPEAYGHTTQSVSSGAQAPLRC